MAKTVQQTRYATLINKLERQENIYCSDNCENTVVMTFAEMSNVVKPQYCNG